MSDPTSRRPTHSPSAELSEEARLTTGRPDGQTKPRVRPADHESELSESVIKTGTASNSHAHHTQPDSALFELSDQVDRPRTDGDA